jgi:flagellin-like protein
MDTILLRLSAFTICLKRIRFSGILHKKGLSGVVTTALLLLLTITAVVIVSSFIIPFVKDNLDSTSCFDYKDYFVFDESFDDFNCFYEGVLSDDNDDEYRISVKVNGNLEDSEKVSGFNLILVETGVGSSTSLNIRDGEVVNGLSMANGEASISIPKPGEVRDGYSTLGYIYSSSEKFTKVDIQTVLGDGKICSSSNSVRIKARC